MAGLERYGDYSRTIVPKKAVQAQDIIYQASKLMAVTSMAGIPTMTINDLMYKEDVTRGRQGEDDVQVDGGFDPTRIRYRQMKTNLKWSIYPYLITEGAKLQSRDPSTLWKDAVSSASEYFAAVRDYRVLSALMNGMGTSAAATANWDANNADIEGDITTALSTIMANSNVKANADGEFTEKMSCVMPADVAFELQKLTLIQNVQRTLGDYLGKSFNLGFFAYRPPVDENGTAYLNGLEDDCLVFVQGKGTCKGLDFSTAEAARRQVQLVEHSRLHGRGDMYTQKMATGALVTWDGINTYSETTPLTHRIYKITDVT